jgi:NNP family nitrate/nitrite transporter-like MFS transporter
MDRDPDAVAVLGSGQQTNEAAYALGKLARGGISTSGGIVYPLVYGYVPNIHMGYAVVALVFFVPFMLFYVWAMRCDEDPREHGFGAANRWLGNDGVAPAGGDD